MKYFFFLSPTRQKVLGIIVSSDDEQCWLLSLWYQWNIKEPYHHFVVTFRGKNFIRNYVLAAKYSTVVWLWANVLWVYSHQMHLESISLSFDRLISIAEKYQTSKWYKWFITVVSNLFFNTMGLSSNFEEAKGAPKIYFNKVVAYCCLSRNSNAPREGHLKSSRGPHAACWTALIY